MGERIVALLTDDSDRGPREDGRDVIERGTLLKGVDHS